MDREVSSGSRFFKVDLHVHTPASLEYGDRNTRPEDIVNKALEEGLDIIAVTDDNDVGWVDKVREAAKGSGLIVFPGVQLTARGGCLLVIFDIDYPQKDMDQLLDKVGISRSNRGKKDIMTDYYIEEVSVKAVKAKGLVIAAHIDQKFGFMHELIRRSQKLKAYNDPNLIALEISEPSLRAKYSGAGGSDYNRNIACIMGSNCYSLSDTGKNFSYIKMDTVSLEGLKQAFYDYEVKIKFQGEKIFSTHPRIVKLQVNQGFFKEETFNFHPNLNCLVGGKGVGKSFTIELVRFALDSQSFFPIIIDDSRSKIRHLVGEGGKVLLWVEDERGRFRIERSVSTEPDKPVIFREGEKEPLPVDVPGFFRIDAYSQGEIVEIARSRFAQLKIVDSFLNLSQEIRAEKRILEQINENTRLLSERQDFSLEYEAIKSDITLLKEKIRILEEKLNDPILKGHQKWIEEKNHFYQFEKGMDTYQVQLFNKWQEVDFEEFFSDPDYDNTPNPDLMEDAFSVILDIREVIEETRAKIKGLISGKKQILREKFDRWCSRFKETQATYKKFLQDLNVPEIAEAEKEYQKFKEEEMEMTRKLSSLEKVNKSSEEIIQKRKNLLRELEDIQKDIFNKRLSISKEVEEKLNGKIKLNITYKGMRDDYFNELIRITQGSRIPADELEKIVQNIIPADLIAMVLDRDYKSISLSSGISETRARQVVEYLFSIDKKSLFDIEIIHLYDDPKLMLKIGDEEYKHLEELSLGAKCTAIIYIAMVGDECPLIIDQPEDALDTLSIFDVIVKKLREEKEKRQFILATHNPNILVAADAELSLVLRASARSGIIQSGGGLDRPFTRDLLLLNLEGGKEAFMMRNQKYAIQSGE